MTTLDEAEEGSHIIQSREDTSGARPGSSSTVSLPVPFASYARLSDHPPNHEDPGSAEMPPVTEAWGSFRLLARVGHGSFGEVYRGVGPVPGGLIGAKAAASRLSGTRGRLPGHSARGAGVSRSATPNIVHVYGIDRHDGRVGYGTDFVRGKTLSFLLSAQGPFGDRGAALIGLDVAKALSAVHRAGLLHRDIKAENVMREEGGRILLMDFGLSTLPQSAAEMAPPATPTIFCRKPFSGIPKPLCYGGQRYLRRGCAPLRPGHGPASR